MLRLTPLGKGMRQECVSLYHTKDELFIAIPAFILQTAIFHLSIKRRVHVHVPVNAQKLAYFSDVPWSVNQTPSKILHELMLISQAILTHFLRLDIAKKKRQYVLYDRSQTHSFA